jgi:putative oxidoreductase
MNAIVHQTEYRPARGAGFWNRIPGLYLQAIRVLDSGAPIADLALRLWVAHAFLVSGLTKIQSWETTLQLFQYEYHVPLLPPAVAAWTGTATEIIFPVFLALGLGSRIAAGVLFVFNIIAVISYPELMGAGIEQHQVWGLMLLVTLLHGPGKLSADHFIQRLISRR